MSNLALKGAGIIHGNAGTPNVPSGGPNEGHHVSNNLLSNMLGPRHSVEQDEANKIRLEPGMPNAPAL